MTTLTSVLFHTLMFETLTKVQRLINIQCLQSVDTRQVRMRKDLPGLRPRQTSLHHGLPDGLSEHEQAGRENYSVQA